MRFLKLALRRETAMPMLALMMASGACVGLVAGRIAWTGQWDYAFLIWNLFLAWMPVVFAFLACDEYREGAGGNWRFLGLGASWLLFFPNAPYIFTDVIHLRLSFYQHFWVDLSLISLCAVTGLVLGFVSLFLMQSVVTRRLGRAAGWLFIAVVAGLSGFGIYLGRILRFNSWDVLFKPVELYRGIGHWAAEPLNPPAKLAFPILFAAFLFFSYLMLYALTHLQQAPVALRTEPERDRALVGS
jgi:uncharacterized membrane protein